MSGGRRLLDHPPGRWRDGEHGVYALEMLGLLPWVVIAAIMSFQLAAIGGAMTMAENAARVGSRTAGLGGDAVAATLDAVDPGMRDRTHVEASGETVTVRIDVPVVIPLIDLDVTTIERSATLPATTSAAGSSSTTDEARPWR